MNRSTITTLAVLPLARVAATVPVHLRRTAPGVGWHATLPFVLRAEAVKA